MNPKADSFRGKDRWDVRKFRVDKDLKFTGPKLIGYYSVNQSQELVEDLSELKYMVKPPGTTYLDLTFGAESSKIKEMLTKHQPFFEYLSRHEDIVEKFESSDLKDVGFIMSRGLFIHVGNIPYNRTSQEIFGAHLLNGAIYLKRKIETRIPTEQDGWGHKFRQYVLSSSTKCEPETDEPINQDQEFNGVFNFKLGNDNILYLSEVDGVLANSIDSREDICNDLDEKSIVDELSSRKFVKLATSIKTDDDPQFAKHKSLQYWLKCFYANNEELYIGFKNKSGIVNEIKKFSLEDLQNMGKTRSYWNPDVIRSFTSEFLTFIKKCFMDKISEDCDIKKLPEIKLFFQYMPSYNKDKGGYFIEIIPEPNDDETSSWLPEWYIEKKSKND